MFKGVVPNSKIHNVSQGGGPNFSLISITLGRSVLIIQKFDLKCFVYMVQATVRDVLIRYRGWIDHAGYIVQSAPTGAFEPEKDENASLQAWLKPWPTFPRTCWILQCFGHDALNQHTDRHTLGKLQSSNSAVESTAHVAPTASCQRPQCPQLWYLPPHL